MHSFNNCINAQKMVTNLNEVVEFHVFVGSQNLAFFEEKLNMISCQTRYFSVLINEIQFSKLSMLNSVSAF